MIRASAAVTAGLAAAFLTSGLVYRAFEGSRPLMTDSEGLAWVTGTWAAEAVLFWLLLAWAGVFPRVYRRCAYCGYRARTRPRGRYWADGEDGARHGRDGWQCRDPHACTDRQPAGSRRVRR